jgi:hypothetical protein
MYLFERIGRVSGSWRTGMKVVSEIWNCEFEISEIGKLERNWEVGGNWKFRKKFGREEEYARGFWKSVWELENGDEGSFRNLEL